MKGIIRIPFELVVNEDIRFYGPSGNYITITNEKLQDDIGRLIKTETEKQINALSSVLNTEVQKPIASKYDKKIL